MSIRPTATERAASLPGDDVVPDATIAMDTAFSLPAPPADVWPWFVQLGKRRAGYYLPRWVEAVTPPSRRGRRHLDPALQGLQVGDTIPDWGGRDATFTAHEMTPPHTLVHPRPHPVELGHRAAPRGRRHPRAAPPAVGRRPAPHPGPRGGRCGGPAHRRGSRRRHAGTPDQRKRH